MKHTIQHLWYTLPLLYNLENNLQSIHMVFFLYSEEEMKRFQQALREDGAYNSVAFNYQYSTPEQLPQNDPSYEATPKQGMWSVCILNKQTFKPTNK